jgi:hypothetical protein
MAIESSTTRAESAASTIGHINFDRNPTGKRSAGNPPATFDAAGAGDVAWWRYRGTRKRKSEQQRTQTSTYTGAPVLDPTCERLGVKLPRPTHPTLGDLVIKIPEGDPPQSITERDRLRPSDHQENWPCSTLLTR